MNFLILLVACSICVVVCDDKKEKPSWTKKDVRDYNDADLERLFDQWEENDEPLEEDELPEYRRQPPKIDLSKMDPNNPEALLKMSKKGRSLMTFVSLLGNPTREETEEITKLWQSSLMNNHINLERYVIADDRVIFMFKDGALAWDAKDYLIQQKELKEITIENKPYYGKYNKMVEDGSAKDEL